MEENMRLEVRLSFTPVKIVSPGRLARIFWPEPENNKVPSQTNSINVVVTILNQQEFPALSNYLSIMLNNLNEQNLLGFINRNVEVRLREFQDGKLKLDPPVETRDLFHKLFNIYVLVLPRHARLILSHL